MVDIDKFGEEIYRRSAEMRKASKAKSVKQGPSPTRPHGVRLERVDRTVAHRQEMVRKMVDESRAESGVDPWYNDGQEEIFWFIMADEYVAGYCAAHSIDLLARRCRGVLHILADFRRKGIGVRALVARNKWLFDELGLNRIEWAIPAENTPRLEMAAKLHQRQEGIARQAAWWGGRYHDLVLFAELREDLAPGRNVGTMDPVLSGGTNDE